MKSMRYLILLSLLFLSGCGGGSTSSNAAPAALATVPPEYEGLANPLGADAAVEGANIFKSNCETCHGPQGEGDGVVSQSLDPKPANLIELGSKVGDDYLFWRIRDGKPGTSMVSWKNILEDEQIWQVVSFIRSWKQ